MLILNKHKTYTMNSRSGNMISLRYFFLLLIFSLNICLAEEGANKTSVGTFGHNLSPSTKKLEQYQATVGFYAMAMGLTDNIMIGTSPWIYSNYNMHNLVGQYNYTFSSKDELAFRGTYFKTYDVENKLNEYKMEAISLHTIWGRKLEKKKKLNFVLGYMYFYDETLPFSLRREPMNDNPYQFSTSVLFESQLDKSWGINLELGVLGVNYVYPQLITGASVTYQYKMIFMQIGMSATGTPNSYFNTNRIDNNGMYLDNYYSRSQYTNKENARRDFSVHPEIQLQYFF